MSYIHCARVSAIDCVSFISGTPQKQKNLMQGSLGANITVCCMDTTHICLLESWYGRFRLGKFPGIFRMEGRPWGDGRGNCNVSK